MELSAEVLIESGVVIGPNRRFNTCQGQSLEISYGQVLPATVGMMNETTFVNRSPVKISRTSAMTQPIAPLNNPSSKSFELQERMDSQVIRTNVRLGAGNRLLLILMFFHILGLVIQLKVSITN